MKLSSFENQRPTGYVPATGTPTENVVSPTAGVDRVARPGASPNSYKMSASECAEYANGSVITSIRSRIVALNESIETIRAEGNSIHEWEALMMVMHELECIIVNIPGYTDPCRGNL